MYILRILLLTTGVLACSTAGLMIRVSRTHALLIAAYRLLIAAALLSPIFLRFRRMYPDYPLARLWRQAGPAALLLALHFWTWNVSVHKTTVANASLIVNLVAVAMPFVVWVMVREGLHVRELAGTALALSGTALLAAADYRLDMGGFFGDLLAFASMLAFALYLAWNRRCQDVPSIWLYAPAVYLLSGLICLTLGRAVGGALLVPHAREWLLLLGLALIPTITGHTILNVSMRTLRSQVVAVVNLAQFLFATALAWWFLDERPGSEFPVAAALVVAGALVVILRPASGDPRRNGSPK